MLARFYRRTASLSLDKFPDDRAKFVKLIRLEPQFGSRLGRPRRDWFKIDRVGSNPLCPVDHPWHTSKIPGMDGGLDPNWEHNTLSDLFVND